MAFAGGAMIGSKSPGPTPRVAPAGRSRTLQSNGPEMHRCACRRGCRPRACLRGSRAMRMVCIVAPNPGRRLQAVVGAQRLEDCAARITRLFVRTSLSSHIQGTRRSFSAVKRTPAGGDSNMHTGPGSSTQARAKGGWQTADRGKEAHRASRDPSHYSTRAIPDPVLGPPAQRQRGSEGVAERRVLPPAPPTVCHQHNAVRAHTPLHGPLLVSSVWRPKVKCTAPAERHMARRAGPPAPLRVPQPRLDSPTYLMEVPGKYHVDLAGRPNP